MHTTHLNRSFGCLVAHRQIDTPNVLDLCVLFAHDKWLAQLSVVAFRTLTKRNKRTCITEPSEDSYKKTQKIVFIESLFLFRFNAEPHNLYQPLCCDILI